MLRNWILYLVGPPGVGKLTVAKALHRRLGCRIIDNHYWLNPILGLTAQDGVTPLPEDVFTLSGQVRAAVFETIATYSPADWSFVFTHASAGMPDERAADLAVAQEIAALAARRNAETLAVRLTCAAAELARRMAMPERRAVMKDINAAAARDNAFHPPIDPDWPRTLAIDTTALSAGETAARIIAAVSGA